jgi:hypothetical protein
VDDVLAHVDRGTVGGEGGANGRDRALDTGTEPAWIGYEDTLHRVRFDDTPHPGRIILRG